MKWLISELMPLAICLSLCASAQAEELHSEVSEVSDLTYVKDTLRNDATNDEKLSFYQKRVERYERAWASFIPRFMSVQYAGSIGVVSAGPGWNYCKGRLETELLFGFLPKFDDDDNKLTLTIRQTYIPWSVKCERLSCDIEPLTVSLAMNSILDNRFWDAEPSKYPKGYYNFSSKIRFHLALGQSITFDVQKHKSIHKEISFYYEIGTCDLYAVSWAVNTKEIAFKDILSLGLGVKLRIF